MVYRNAYLDALFLTEFTREWLKFFFQSFFYRNSRFIFKDAKILKQKSILYGECRFLYVEYFKAKEIPHVKTISLYILPQT